MHKEVRTVVLSHIPFTKSPDLLSRSYETELSTKKKLVHFIMSRFQLH